MGIKSGINRSKHLIIFLLAAVVMGCAAKATALPPTVPSPTLAARVTPTSPPVPVMSPDRPSTPEVRTGEATERLIVRRIVTPPVIDGQVDATWTTAELLLLPLTFGTHGSERALDVELRGLRTDGAVYFLAQWPGELPPGDENTILNTFTVHWRIPDAAARRLDCAVACHTANASSQGQFVYANAETIPQGGDGALPVAGGWHVGTWTLEWSRPLINGNPFDLQFDDLKGEYLFLVKVFERIEGRPDPVSLLCQLVFED